MVDLPSIILLELDLRSRKMQVLTLVGATKRKKKINCRVPLEFLFETVMISINLFFIVIRLKIENLLCHFKIYSSYTNATGGFPSQSVRMAGSI